MNDVMQEVDERSNLAGTNKFELLIFRLGEDRNSNTREVFGMNVFKVREALIMPSITPMPGSPKHVLGVANIRGQIIPVIDLPSVVGCTPSARNILLVTEYERSVQGFAVEEVEEIVRLEWGRVVSAEKAAAGALVTSLARLDENQENARLALILDVESILRETLPSRFKSGEEISITPSIQIPQGSVIVYADDSSVARRQIETVLTRFKLPFLATKTGQRGVASSQEHGAGGPECRDAHKPESRDGADGSGDARDGRVHADPAVEGRRFAEECSRRHSLVTVGFRQRIPCEEGRSGRLRGEVRSR